jgi:hypothetical protein
VTLEELDMVGARTVDAQTQVALGGTLRVGIDVHLTPVQWYPLWARRDPAARTPALELPARRSGLRVHLAGADGTAGRFLGPDGVPTILLTTRSGRCTATFPAP